MQEQKYELTSPQKSIWVTEQYYKDTAVNTICGTAIIHDKINFELLKKSMQIVIKNNDVLKIRFGLSDGKLYQTLSDEVNSTIIHYSVESMKELEKIRDEQIASKRFDILNSFAYGFYTFELSDKTGGFIISMHHILADSWTLGLLSKQVVNAYSALVQGENYIPETNSYIDYIFSEEEYKQSERYQKDKAYWMSQFETIPETANIPASKVLSTDVNNCAGNRIHYNLDKKLISKLKHYAQENHISLYNFFMAIYSIYIREITGLDDFSIGTPILNRTNPKEKNTPGMFINMAPLRINFDGILTFKEFIKNISLKSLGMLKHQKYSYQSLLEELRKEKRTIATLFNTVFSYQITITQAEDSSFAYTSDWNFNGNCADNLAIHVFDLDNTGGLNVCYDYKTSIYSEEDIEKMHNRILYLIDQVISSENILLKDIEIVTPKEKDLVLNKFNHTDFEYDKTKTLIDLFEEKANEKPDNIAIIYDSKEYSYKTLNNMANIIATHITNTIEEKNKKIAVLCKKSAWTLASFLGIMKSGNCYIPIDIDYPEDRIKYILEDSNCSLIITEQENNFSKEFKNKIILNNLDDKKVVKYESKATPENIAYMIYTSGTTGKPKGVIIKHKNIINTLLWRKNYYIFNDRITIFAVPSFSFDSSVEDIFTPLISGAKLVIPVSPKIDINEMCEAIKKYDVNNFLVVPSLYKILLHEKAYFLERLKFVTIAGEGFNISLVKEHFDKLPNVRLINEYGPTENSVCSTYYELTSKDEEIFIGKPINNCKCYVLGNNLQILPPDTPGELYLSGPGISDGYYNKSEMTKEKFLANPFGGKYKLYKTGDIVKFSSNGNLIFIGRTDDQIKLNGFRIELREIEQNLLKNPNVADVVVAKKLSNNNKPILVAYVISKGNSLDISALYKDLRETLPQYMVPNIMEIDKFPLTPNGKIDIKALPLPYNKKPVRTMPSTETENKILMICRQVLNNNDLTISDDLFNIGGADSLDILTINSRLFAQDIKFNTQDFYKYPTVQELADILTENDIEFYDNNQEIIKPQKTVFPKNISAENLNFKYKNVLLAGSTGFLGIHILDYLLKNTNSNIYCIIRKKYSVEPEKRLEGLLNYYFDSNYYNQFKDRIIVLDGELSEENFALSKKEYDNLSHKIDCIINAAANTKHYGSYANFEKENVATVKTLITFAKDNKILLNHMSTTTISGNFLVDNDIFYNFTENDFYIGQNYMDNSYVRSKFEAEKAILEEERNGLKANIFRLGNLMARFSDGKFQKNKFDNAYYTRLLALATLGCLPDNLKTQYLEFTPIDETAEAIIKLLSIPNLYNSIFHVFSNKLIHIDTFLKVLESYGFSCKFIDYDKFIDKLYLQKNEKILKYLISDLNTSRKFDYTSNIVIDQTLTNDFLNFVSFEWSNIDEDYLKRFLDSTNFTKDIEV